MLFDAAFLRIRGASFVIRLVSVVCLAVSALLVFAPLRTSVSAAKKKPPIGWVQRPTQSARLAQMPLVVAKQKCENWAWAASLEAILRLQKAPITQEYWVQRLNNGEVCLPRAASFENLVRFLESDFYVLDDGRKLRLKVQYGEGAPTSADDLIISVQRNDPMMLFWRGHAYVVAGVVYNEYFSPNGGHRFEVQQIKLLDPYIDPKARPERPSGRTVFESRQEEPAASTECADPVSVPPSTVDPAAAVATSSTPPTAEKKPCLPEDPRIVSFVKGRDNLAEIDGTMQVHVVWQ